MQNDKKEVVDLYIPRKCSATNRLVTAKDHAAVQLNIGKVDDKGRLTGEVEAPPPSRRHAANRGHQPPPAAAACCGGRLPIAAAPLPLPRWE